MPTVLVIEDSAFQRKIISSAIKELGYDVITAENGQEGIERMVDSAPVLAFSDLLMPEFDGDWVLDQAKRRGIGVPIVILTSDVQNTTRERCLKKGAKGFLNKPVNRETLQKTIQDVLHGEKR